MSPSIVERTLFLDGAESMAQACRGEEGNPGFELGLRLGEGRREGRDKVCLDAGLFVQVVDETGEDVPIPGRGFGFATLIRAQAVGDLAALEERGRRVIRIRLEDL